MSKKYGFHKTLIFIILYIAENTSFIFEKIKDMFEKIKVIFLKTKDAKKYPSNSKRNGNVNFILPINFFLAEFPYIITVNSY